MNNIYEDILEWEIFGIEEIPQENKSYELLGDLNPRFFEEAIKLEDVNNMIFSQVCIYGSMFDISSVY